MNNIWESESILNEEDWYVIANNIPISLISIELDSKSTDISHGISASP